MQSYVDAHLLPETLPLPKSSKLVLAELPKGILNAVLLPVRQAYTTMAKPSLDAAFDKLNVTVQLGPKWHIKTKVERDNELQELCELYINVYSGCQLATTQITGAVLFIKHAFVEESWEAIDMECLGLTSLVQRRAKDILIKLSEQRRAIYEDGERTKLKSVAECLNEAMEMRRLPFRMHAIDSHVSVEAVTKLLGYLKEKKAEDSEKHKERSKNIRRHVRNAQGCRKD